VRSPSALTELFAMGRMAESESLAPPNAPICFLLTQTKLFMFMMMEFWPVAKISPLAPSVDHGNKRGRSSNTKT